MTAAAALWTFRARLIRVVDADTFEIELDTGFHSRHVERVRLAGADAPERNTAAGKMALIWAIHWFQAASSDSSRAWPLIVRTRQVDSRSGVLQDMSLGRYIAHITSASTGQSLTDDIIAAGYATPSEDDQ